MGAGVLRRVLVRTALMVAAGFAWAAPTAARSVCDGYPERLSERELNEYSDALVRPLPARYADLLGRVRVANAVDEDSLAPAAFIPLGAGGDVTIAVPRGFKRLSCRLMQEAAGHMAQLYPPGDSPRPAFEACVRSGGTRRDCLERVLAERTRALDTRFENDSQYASAMKRWVERAFRFMLAHEAAHIVFQRASATQPLLNGLDTETAADLQAMLTLPTNDEDILPAIAQLATWSMVDRTIDWTRANHAPFACRASTAATLYKELQHGIVLVNLWASDPEDYAKYRARKYDLGSLHIAGDTSHCGNPVAPQIGKVRSDLDRLLAAIDKIEAMDSKNGPAILDLLLGVELATDEVRGLRAHSLTHWALRFVTDDLGDQFSETGDLSPEELDGIEAMGKRRAMRKYKELQRSALADLRRTIWTILGKVELEADLQLLPATSYGHFVVRSELVRMAFNNASDIGRIEVKLRHVKRYAPGSALIPVLEGFVALSRQDCAGGRKLFREAIRRDPSYANELSSFVEPSEGVSCAMFSRMF